MSEQLLRAEDLRAFDCSIGVEAAQSINALVTDAGLSYNVLHESHRAGELASHIGAYLIRTEETIDRHIGRRQENDALFVGTGQKEILPAHHEPWTPQGAIEAQTQPITEEKIANRAMLYQKIHAATEPVYNAFLDKLPQQPRRWGRASKPIHWEEQNNSSTYRFTLNPNADRSFGYSQIACHVTTPDTYCGVYSQLSVEDTRPTSLATQWMDHMDFRDEDALLNTLAPGLLDFTQENNVKGINTHVSINFKDMVMTHTGQPFDISCRNHNLYV